MPAKSDPLRAARRAKKDEFYTQREDIEQEMMHYWQHFKGKTVLLNCDDPFESNFFFYFASYFNTLGLKKLIAVSYKGSPVAGTDGFYDNLINQVYGLEDRPENHPYKAVMTCLHDTDGDTGINKKDIKELFEMGENTLTRLKGDGDFRSQECIELLQEADIVVTNPPFSLFREYVAQLVQYDKKFLIIGNKNAIAYKEIFPLMKENKIWLGYRPMGSDILFTVPKEYQNYLVETKKESSAYRMKDGVVMGRTSAVWFTNLDHSKRHEWLDLVERYYGKLGTPEKYPHYDNYDAIEVSKVADIPKDYEGVMGVPITFMDKYNPEQFEILGTSSPYYVEKLGIQRIGEKWISDYKQNGGTGHITANMHSLVYYDSTGKPISVYNRILIRNRHPAEKEYME